MLQFDVGVWWSHLGEDLWWEGVEKGMERIAVRVEAEEGCVRRR